jgi:hypothetical protein
VFEAGRGLMAGSPVKLLVAFGSLAVCVAIFAAFSRRGLRSAERAG